jgi:hypothetical protein
MTEEHKAAIEAAVNGGRAALNGFTAAFNARDAEAIRSRRFHFPHVRFHSGKGAGMQTPVNHSPENTVAGKTPRPIQRGGSGAGGRRQPRNSTR